MAHVLLDTEEGEANVTTALFDDQVEKLNQRVSLQQISKMTEEYFVRGCTALLDAIGLQFILWEIFKSIKKRRTERVRLFLITTDGHENSSKEYTFEKIKKMIEHQKEQYNLEFIFRVPILMLKKLRRRLVLMRNLQRIM